MKQKKNLRFSKCLVLHSFFLLLWCQWGQILLWWSSQAQSSGYGIETTFLFVRKVIVRWLLSRQNKKNGFIDQKIVKVKQVRCKNLYIKWTGTYRNVCSTVVEHLNHFFTTSRIHTVLWSMPLSIFWLSHSTIWSLGSHSRTLKFKSLPFQLVDSLLYLLSHSRHIVKCWMLCMITCFPTTDASIGFEAGVPHSKDVLVVSFMPDVTGAKLYKKFQKPLFGTSIWESRCVFFSKWRQAFVLFLVSGGFYSPRGDFCPISFLWLFFFFQIGSRCVWIAFFSQIIK